MIRQPILTSSSIALAMLLAVSPLQARILDRTLATVNGEAIMQSEFEKNATPILDQFKKVTPPADQTADRVTDIKKRVLDQMIDDKILAQEAKKQNIHVS